MAFCCNIQDMIGSSKVLLKAKPAAWRRGALCMQHWRYSEGGEREVNGASFGGSQRRSGSLI